jgi:type II secretory pathway predicted ATPase ExeA
MYHEHFGLEQSLFEGGIAHDSGVFFGDGQARAAAALTVALTLRDSVAVVVGPAGVGKTTIASHTLRAMATRLALGWLGSAPLTSHELLEMLLTEYGFTPYKHSRVERLQMWRQFLNEMSVTDTRVCILVENADAFAPEILAALESMTAADPSGCPGANIVLTFRGPINDLFANPLLASLQQRTRTQHRLAALDRAELQAYLAHRARAAGTAYDAIFAPDAAGALQTYSGGVIRVANNLCETALVMAANLPSDRLTAEIVARTAIDVFGMPPAAAPAATISAAMPRPLASPDLAPATAAARADTDSMREAHDPPTKSHSPAPTITPAGADRPRHAEPPTTASQGLLDRTDEVPLLTLEGEDDGFCVDLDLDIDIDIDIEMDDVQIDDVLRDDVPTLTDSIDMPADAFDAGDSIRVGLDENTQHELANVEAFAHAKALEDLSNSMAETSFEDAELEKLATTLAVSCTRDDDETDQPLVPRAASRL